MQGWKKWEWKFVDEKLGNKVLRSRSAGYDSCFAHNAHCCLLRLHPLLYCLHNCSTDFSSLGFNYACQAFKKVTSNQKSDFFLDPIEHGSLFFNGPKLGEPLVFRPPALPPFLAPYVMASYQVVWVKSTAKIQFVIYLKRLFFLVYWESCWSSTTYDLWLKAESWSLNFKILKKKSLNNLRFNELQLDFGNSIFFLKLRYLIYIFINSRFKCKL